MANFDDVLENNPVEQVNQPLSKEEYAAKKQAERDEVYKLADNTAMEVAADGGKFKQYLDVQAQFGRYSTVNALLILAQKPESTRLADFDHWKSQGVYVKSGQTGISILEPGKEYEREDGSVGVSYNIKKVFDVSQVDAKKLKSEPAPKFTERQILAALISKAPMKITGVTELPDGGGARTDPDTGEVQVLKGMEFSDTFRSVAHELCYAEAARDENIADPQFSAYCASYMLCKKHGVDTKDYNFDSAVYVLADKEPGRMGEQDAKRPTSPQAVKHELSQIREAADAIDRRMAKQLDAVAKAAKNRDEAR